MKICFVEPHIAYGIGGIRRILEISNRLHVLGHQVFIYHPSGKKTTWLPINVPVLKLEKLSEQKFDVVIFNLAEQYKHVLNCESKVKIFFVLAPEALYKQPDIPIIALQQNFFFLANSTFTANYIKQYRRVKYEIPILNGGVNPDHFRYDPDCPKTHHVLYSGSKRPWKGATLIQQALSGSNLKILNMGKQKVLQKDLWKSFNSSSIFVSACQAEGFNFMPLEAMACGCPVVTTDDGGNRDYITDKNAITVKRNAQSIRQGIHLLLNDKDLRRKLKKEGLKTARDPKYNWDNVTKKLENVLEGILKNGTIRNV